MSAAAGIDAEQRMLIDGELVGATGGRVYDNVNPATEEVIGVAADATVEDMERAIASARRAFDESAWANDLDFRVSCLLQLRAALDEYRETLRATLTAENGSTNAMGAIQVDDPIDHFMPAHIETGRTYQYEHSLGLIERFGTKSDRIVRREPIGVVAAITPWNAPFYLNLAKIVPALVSGCTVILKPAPDTPWSGSIIGKLIAEKTDIPPGVINVVTTLDNSVAEQLTTDARVDCVHFTGSTGTGRLIMRNGAETLKKVCLELGGKSAAIVLDDADIAAAVIGVATSVCINAGQGCTINTRLLLPRSKYDEGVAVALETMRNIPYGDPTVDGNLYGPLINKRQHERVLSLIEAGSAQDTLALGGHAPEHLAKGYYVEPTLFTDVDPDHRIAQEEVFGPVLSVIPYDGDAEAVDIANNSIFGLNGSVVSADQDRALGVARQVRAGTISVNGGNWFAADAPFGGYRQSGLGREHGVLGFEEFLEIKTIGIPAPA
ncbi:MAG: aldehyde dehydrogenase family protein [Ilumatobacteraceae bacterium]